jgi:hypothetical protein
VVADPAQQSDHKLQVGAAYKIPYDRQLPITERKIPGVATWRNMTSLYRVDKSREELTLTENGANYITWDKLPASLIDGEKYSKDELINAYVSKVHERVTFKLKAILAQNGKTMYDIDFISKTSMHMKNLSFLLIKCIDNPNYEATTEDIASLFECINPMLLKFHPGLISTNISDFNKPEKAYLALENIDRSEKLSHPTLCHDLIIVFGDVETFKSETPNSEEFKYKMKHEHQRYSGDHCFLARSELVSYARMTIDNRLVTESWDALATEVIVMLMNSLKFMTMNYAYGKSGGKRGGKVSLAQIKRGFEDESPLYDYMVKEQLDFYDRVRLAKEHIAQTGYLNDGVLDIMDSIRIGSDFGYDKIWEKLDLLTHLILMGDKLGWELTSGDVAKPPFRKRLYDNKPLSTYAGAQIHKIADMYGSSDPIWVTFMDSYFEGIPAIAETKVKVIEEKTNQACEAAEQVSSSDESDGNTNGVGWLARYWDAIIKNDLSITSEIEIQQLKNKLSLESSSVEFLTALSSKIDFLKISLMRKRQVK